MQALHQGRAKAAQCRHSKQRGIGLPEAWLRSAGWLQPWAPTTGYAFNRQTLCYPAIACSF